MITPYTRDELHAMLRAGTQPPDPERVRGVDLSGLTLAHLQLPGMKLAGIDLSIADLASADLSGADLSDANLSDANLVGANLSGTRLSRTNLCNADLTGAKLDKALLDQADITNADLRFSKLTNADLTGAILTNAMLFQADLTGATIDWRAVWPILRWYAITEALAADCMRYDASLHPDPDAFDRWAAGGECPYIGAYGNVPRPIPCFTPLPRLWKRGPALPADILAGKLCRYYGIKGHPFPVPT